LTEREDGRRMNLVINLVSSLSAHEGKGLEELCLPRTAVSNCLMLFLFQEVLKVWERRAILILCISNSYNCFSEA